tara:strand:+ start:1762 stop:2211 length:450 start_codon:yes stop_codon:yes gene_type:complete
MKMKSPNPDAEVLRSVFADVSLGDKAAYDYMWLWIKATRLIDDLFDEPEDWKERNTYELAQTLLVDLPANAFLHANSAALLPHHLTVLNAWRDSNDWKKSGDKSKELHAFVMCEQTSDIFLLVAYLKGGYEHMRKVSLKVRELFLKEEI